MAEIKIEKKKAVWPWVLLALVLIAGIIYLYYSLTTTRDSEAVATGTEVTQPNNNIDTVNDFVTYVNSDTNKMGLDHSYTSDALVKLTQAVSAKANAIGYDIKADLDQVKQYADRITNDPFETSHADDIRKAADILSNSLQNIQEAKYPALSNDAREVKDAAAAIKPDVLTLDQKDAVKAFFSDAADLLQKMS